MLLDHFERHDSCAIGDKGPVLFIEIDGPLAPADIEAMAMRADAQRTSFEKNATITLVHRIPMPDGATRESAARLSSRNSNGTTSVVVIMDTGLWASAARSVLTGIYLLSGRHQEHRVCTSTDEAVAYIAKTMQLPADRLRLSLEAFRNKASHRPAARGTPAPR